MGFGAASDATSQRVAPNHLLRTTYLLAETALVSIALTAASIWCSRIGAIWAVWLLALPRGLWIQRHYCVGHEASHLKLFPSSRRWNAVFGQLYLLPLLTPLAVFRKIHMFHHGNNRRDHHTSALDVIWLPRDRWYFRVYGWLRWLFATYLGGWFWHGLVSILLFLLLPVSLARRISPAFEGWTTKQRLESIVVFGVALAVLLWPLAVGYFQLWVAVWGAPLVVFSWFYSAHLYVYHYRTGFGPSVRNHARHLGGRLASWWLLNLNHHDTHHARPAVVWYAIPHVSSPTRAVEFGSGKSLWWGILHQLRGPLFLTRAGHGVATEVALAARLRTETVP